MDLLEFLGYGVNITPGLTVLWALVSASSRTRDSKMNILLF